MRNSLNEREGVPLFEHFKASRRDFKSEALNITKHLPINLTVKQILTSKPKFSQLNCLSINKPKNDVRFLLNRQCWKPQNTQKLVTLRKCNTAPEYCKNKYVKKADKRSVKTAPLISKRKLPISSNQSLLKVKKKMIYPKPIKESCEKFLSYRQRKVLMQQIQQQRIRLVSL